ncbi:ScbA/BarX family gamma-butyrolactone biosynthesis protein [Streptomyces sp. NBC_01565]|uniref:ScbA/BarX family gamma-butyrolactone biosynthesis protein n=1 Tax=unclassified Streptomyces TaxID=2593676 RepID=UPI00224F635A|nr:ScbA/BarX family gamma-butyrolactone biosynthesis protein [Streptomyces sp. NBC_01565]MCX4545914.1 ScbA/BarX family gamma-butyrolactone biosynthesis protein [Streptomyces sp. NBC_01565]
MSSLTALRLPTFTPGCAPTAADSPLTTTVPRQYVHRAAVSEVLLTGWGPDPLGAETDQSDSYVVRAQWPRGHSLFTPVGGYQDPLLLIESVRQSGSLLAHSEYGVPFGHQFLMWDMSFIAAPEALLVSPVPTEVELRIACRDIVRRGRTIASMRYEVSVWRDGAPLATASAGYSCTSPAVHRRLRGERPTTTDRTPPPAIDAARVGRAATPGHVVLAPADGGRARLWELRVDTAHPIFFDHPVDHVPGMVLLESARQAAHAATRLPDALVLGMASTFERYAELDAPCWIEADVAHPDAAGDIAVAVRGTQQDRQVFTADLVLRPRTV